jgi:hemoglobin-like flavoprotein
MALTPQQIKLVQNSWKFVTVNISEAGMIFYERLFIIDPSLRVLFKGDIEQQSRSLVTMISYAVNKLDAIGDIVPEIEALGQRHVKYNVTPEHYTTVANALLWTLEKALSDQWTEEMKNAWIAVYTLLSETMRKAAK